MHETYLLWIKRSMVDDVECPNACPFFSPWAGHQLGWLLCWHEKQQNSRVGEDIICDMKYSREGMFLDHVPLGHREFAFFCTTRNGIIVGRVTNYEINAIAACNPVMLSKLSPIDLHKNPGVFVSMNNLSVTRAIRAARLSVSEYSTEIHVITIYHPGLLVQSHRHAGFDEWLHKRCKKDLLSWIKNTSITDKRHAPAPTRRQL